MIRINYKLPKKITIALSGGVDSVAITDFLSRKHEVSCAFFHHHTETSAEAAEFVIKFCEDRKLPLTIGFLCDPKPQDLSKEEHWRNERYKFLESRNEPVVTGHNLDDCVETYIWSALHGTPKVIPIRRNNNIIRPFLTTRKLEFIRWCRDHCNIQYCHDLSNDDIAYTRNYIRHTLMPHALKVNPGLYKTVQKIVEKQAVS